MLVDTSVWIDHLRHGNGRLADSLENGEVECHPFVIGELACGRLSRREEILALLRALPQVVEADHDEALAFIESNRLMGQGLGFIDVHLMASAILTKTPLWTMDERLAAGARRLGIAFRQGDAGPDSPTLD